MLKQAGRTSEVANLAEHDREDRLDDLSRSVYALCARLYGQQRAKGESAKMIQEWEAPDALS